MASAGGGQREHKSSAFDMTIAELIGDTPEAKGNSDAATDATENR